MNSSAESDAIMSAIFLTWLITTLFMTTITLGISLIATKERLRKAKDGDL
jgi:hypothetical protein